MQVLFIIISSILTVALCLGAQLRVVVPSLLCTVDVRVRHAHHLRLVQPLSYMNYQSVTAQKIAIPEPPTRIPVLLDEQCSRPVQHPPPFFFCISRTVSRNTTFTSLCFNPSHMVTCNSSLHDMIQCKKRVYSEECTKMPAMYLCEPICSALWTTTDFGQRKDIDKLWYVSPISLRILAPHLLVRYAICPSKPGILVVDTGHAPALQSADQRRDDAYTIFSWRATEHDSQSYREHTFVAMDQHRKVTPIQDGLQCRYDCVFVH